jgi:hypothetical protein
MSGDAHDPVSAAPPDHDLVLIWNGLVTRIRRSVGERQDGDLAATTFAGQGRRSDAAAKTRPAELPGIGRPEPTPIDPDLP